MSAVEGWSGRVDLPEDASTRRWHQWVRAPQADSAPGLAVLGFASDEEASVIVMGGNGRHLTLHVIRPDTDEDDARRALDAVRASTTPAAAVSLAVRVTVGRSVADVADKLARHEGRGDERRNAQIRRWCEETAQRFIDAPVQTEADAATATDYRKAIGVSDHDGFVVDLFVPGRPGDMSHAPHPLEQAHGQPGDDDEPGEGRGRPH